MRQHRTGRGRLVLPVALTVATAAGGMLAGCGSAPPAGTTSTFPGAARPAGSWAAPNGNLANTRDATGSVIDSSDVARLREAWTFKLAGTAATGVASLGSLAAAPVVAGGVVYLQDLYANVYAITLASGKLRWEYQAVPNDFKDYDMQLSPIAATVGGVPAVIGGGKMGYVYAMNAKTGALLWKTPVGAHNSRDDDSRLLLEHKTTITLPYTFLPGALGGILTNMAAANGSVYLATLDYPITAKTLSTVNGTPTAAKPAGEIEALSLATGKVEWDTKVPTLPLGAATVANDLVFTTLYNGELLALNRATGAIVYRKALPTSTNAPIAIAGNTVLVPAGGQETSAKGGGGSPQLAAYTVP